MKNNQLNNKSINDYYTTASDDNDDSMLAQYYDRESHYNTTRNSSSMFYKFLKTSSKILNYIFYNIIPIGLSAFLITVLIGLIIYSKNITSVIIVIFVFIVNILANFSNPPSNK